MHARWLWAVTLAAIPGSYAAPTDLEGIISRQNDPNGNANDTGVPENTTATPDIDLPWTSIAEFLSDPDVKANYPDMVGNVSEIVGSSPDVVDNGPPIEIKISATNLTLSNGTVISSDDRPDNNNTLPDEKRGVGDLGPPGPYPDSIHGHMLNSFLSLGDSYSAGPQLSNAWPTPPKFPPKYSWLGCKQTTQSWPPLLKSNLELEDRAFTFSACSGFDTGNIIDSSINGDQANWPKDPDLVSVTMGGNNNKAFMGVIVGCLLTPNSQGCTKAIKNAEDTFNGIDEQFHQVIRAIRVKDRGPFPNPKRRTILVMGYPKLYEEGALPNCHMPEYRRTQINNLVELVNSKLMNDAKIAGDESPATNVVFMDPNNPDAQMASRRSMPANLKFEGNRYCNTENKGWSFLGFGAFPADSFTNPKFKPVSYLASFFHPNRAGHAAMAAAAQQALANEFPA